MKGQRIVDTNGGKCDISRSTAAAVRVRISLLPDSRSDNRHRIRETAGPLNVDSDLITELEGEPFLRHQRHTRQ